MTMTEAEATDLFRRPPALHLDVGVGEFAYRRVGAGPDVLFVHGWPVCGATFRHLLPHLAAHLTCHLIDLPGAGDSRYAPDAPITMASHVESVRRVVDALGLARFAVVGHDSGGMIARQAFAGDPRLRAMVLVNTEQPQGLSWRFRAFLLPRSLPGFPTVFRWILGQRWLRRHPLVLGDAFADRSRLDGDFDALFLAPLRDDPVRFRVAIRVLRSFRVEEVRGLAAVHQRIHAPVRLIWGDRDPFFPVARAREMVATFPRAELEVIRGGGLFVHEERAGEVARGMLSFLAQEA